MSNSKNWKSGEYPRINRRGLIQMGAMGGLGLALGGLPGRSYGQDAPLDFDALFAKIEQSPAPGQYGEPAVLTSEISLTAEEVTEIRAMGAKAALVFHYTSTDWAKAQQAGQRKALEELGIEVIAVTDADYRAERQVNDIETVMALKPDIIIATPAEQSATSDAFKRAAAAGIHIVFFDQTGANMEHGKEFVSNVATDNKGMGKMAALMMAKELNGVGKIGLIPHASDLFATTQREVGFLEQIADFPGIEIIANQGFGGPDFSVECERIASGMLTAHPDMNGIWAAWDVPTEGVLLAARNSGRSPSDLIITTCDLGLNIAIDMARNGFVRGTGSQRPFPCGYAEGLLAGYALIGKYAPPYVVAPALGVVKSNLIKSWPLSNGYEAPEIITETLAANP